jgi:hypothetical protein
MLIAVSLQLELWLFNLKPLCSFIYADNLHTSIVLSQ